MFLFGCNIHTPVHITDENGKTALLPVLILPTQNQSQQKLDFICIGTRDCYQPIDLPDETIPFSSPEFDIHGNMFIPIRTIFKSQPNQVGFIVQNKTEKKMILANVIGLRWDEEIRSIIVNGSMLFTIAGMDEKRVFLLDDSGLLTTITIDVLQGIDSVYLIKKNKDESLIIRSNPEIQDGQYFADVWVLNHFDHSLQLKKVLAPRSVIPEPGIGFGEIKSGIKYGLTFNGITADMSYLYYQYSGLDQNAYLMQLIGSYDIKSQQDRNLQGNGCIGDEDIKEYKKFLYRDQYKAFGDSSSITGLILTLDRVEPIIDIKDLDKSSSAVRIAPWEETFLLGTDTKLLQIDFYGNVLNEFLLQNNVPAKNYFIVKYEN